jgi:hypothetical protein
LNAKGETVLISPFWISPSASRHSKSISAAKEPKLLVDVALVDRPRSRRRTPRAASHDRALPALAALEELLLLRIHDSVELADLRQYTVSGVLPYGSRPRSAAMSLPPM